MAQITSDVLVAPQGLFTSADTAQTNLGARSVSGDGREYRYVSAGAVALVPGTLLQSSAEVTNHQNLTPVNASAGAVSITVALGATAVTENFYADGWAVITTSTGAGYQYQISSHAAALSSANLVVNLADPLLVGIVAASSKVDLVANPYKAVVINPATATSAPIGVAVTALGVGKFGWAQVKGPATVLADGAVTVGTAVAASNATAGAVEALTGVQAAVGTAITGIATTQYGAINLDL